MALVSCSVAWTQTGNGDLRCTGTLTEEASQLDQLNTVLNEIYSFDLAIFSIVMGTLIVAFITGHWAGKVARILSRT